MTNPKCCHRYFENHYSFGCVVHALNMAYGRYARRSYGGYNRRPSYGARSYRRSYARSRAAPTRRRRTYSRASSTRRPRTSQRMCPCDDQDLSPGQKFLLAQGDPFEPRALGCKIPDSSTQPSVPIACQELSGGPVVTVPATDVSAIAYLPGLSNSILQATSGGGSWTWPVLFTGSNWNKRTDVVAAVEAARPVAHGLRISSNTAPTSATGYVHLALAIETINNGVTTWPYATSIAQMSGYSWYKRVTLASLTQTPLTIINKYVDETAFRYLGIDGPVAALGANANTFHIPLSWGALLIAVEGVPSTQPVQVEMMLHLECIPKNVGVLSGSSAAPSSPGLLASAASVSSKTDFAHTEDQQDSYMAQVAHNALAGAADAGNAFNQNVILPIVRRAGNAAVNAALSAAIAGVGGIVGVNSNPRRLQL